jgi:hypothetical protein
MIVFCPASAEVENKVVIKITTRTIGYLTFVENPLFTKFEPNSEADLFV